MAPPKGDAVEQSDNGLLGVAIGAMFAVFTALMKMLSMASHLRPGRIQILGRLGIAWSSGWLVCSAIRHYLPGVPEDLLWGVAGGAGLFGDAIYLSLGEMIDRKYGTALMKNYHRSEDRPEK